LMRSGRGVGWGGGEWLEGECRIHDLDCGGLGLRGSEHPRPSSPKP
jgi:hypothetical protein